MKNLQKMGAALGVAATVATGSLGAVALTAGTVQAVTVETATVNSGVTLNVRTGAGTNYSIAGKVTGGTVLTGVANGGWFKITSGAYAGKYVSASYVTVKAPQPPQLPGARVKGSVVNSSIKFRVHSTPATSSPTLRYMTRGMSVDGVLAGDWIKLDAGGYLNKAEVTTTPLSNGALPAARLCNVPTAWNSPNSFAPSYTVKTVRRFDCNALKSLTSLQAAYKAKFGHYAFIDLAYRPLSEQYYWFNRFGAPRAAKPGTSNHGLGLAVDFRELDKAGEEFGWGGYGYNWLKANAGKYGFVNTFAYGTWGESYHWDFAG